MLTTGLNSLAMARLGGFRVLHGGGGSGFALLLIGLLAIGAAVWAVSRSVRSEPAKN